MLTVLSVIGTRPEAIKMAPVVRELAARESDVRPVTCLTGQHREMVEPVLSLFDIDPDYRLDVMQHDQSLSALTARLFTAFDEVVAAVKPDWILAQGDTTSVLVAGVVAYYHRVRFGHVEAGLRTGDKGHPFPEEVNRRIADVVADAFFAPTAESRANLLAEGAAPERVLVTGNTVVDALLEVTRKPFDPGKGPLAGMTAGAGTVLITAHRRESFGGPFREMCTAIRELAGRFPDHSFIYPVHLNPNVRAPVGEILGDLTNVSLIEPVDYRAMAHLMKTSALILTDSGGIQEEAPTFATPVLVMRDTTERPEGVRAGVVKLVGTKRATIVREATAILGTPRRQSTAAVQNPYGDGLASRRIVDHVLGRDSIGEFTPVVLAGAGAS